MLHLNGQNLRLAAKNGCNSKTPGLHLSATRRKEAVGRPPPCSLTQEGTAQLDVLLKQHRPDLEREAESHLVRRPLMLAPLDLSEEVREAQRQKLKFLQQDTKPTSCKPDVTANESSTRMVRSSVRQRPLKATVHSLASAEHLKAQNTSLRPQLTHSKPTEPNKDSHQEVVCRGTPATLCNRPAPPLISPRAKFRVSCAAETVCQDPSTLQQELGKRRLRLRRVQCLEEDQDNLNTSTGGLSADRGELSQGVQGKGQQVEKAPGGGQQYDGKSIKKPITASLEYENIRKSHQKVCSVESVRCILNEQSAEGGSNERLPAGIKPKASNLILKRKKPLLIKHDYAVPLERLQL
ncbi:uncharacterized protein [Antennarius striatus]|uniref:uncharacterized protein n=1 Tax=Antennarius striatus TaxID=241820 RepID=UPI0035B18B04